MDSSAMFEFWHTVEERFDPKLTDHPMITQADWTSTYIPVAIHGDAVPVVKVCKAWSKSYDIYPTSSLMADEKRVLLSNYALACLRVAT